MTNLTPSILRIALPVPLRRTFDYLVTKDVAIETLKPGIRIKVPFQNRELVGIFLETINASKVEKHKLKPILEILDQEPVLDTDIMQLCLWASDYYHFPIGEVLTHALPSLVRQGRNLIASEQSSNSDNDIKNSEELVLNDEQHNAVETILATKDAFKIFLLDGVTGSGKTEVYLQVIHHFLHANKQVLVLVPEIGLTPQTIQRFEERFCVPIVSIHSRIREKQRLSAWEKSKSGEAKIIIGTRSAIFSPFSNLGLVIVDEEHDLSFKQQEGFRYHARDLGIMRAHFKKIPIILGSATPACETLHKALRNQYSHLRLNKRAGMATLPLFQILDVRNKTLDQGLSQELISEIKMHLQENNQVMLFLNRRGYAPVLMCHSCGWTALCKRCDIRMTYHQEPFHLHCHHCDTRKKIPEQCGHCNEKNLITIGIGTERIEVALRSYFPNSPIVRMDRDSIQGKGKMEEVLNKIQNNEAKLLIGTQMLAKGHHFPNVTLVAIVDADHGFFSSDFRALERMGQLVLQVSGRAGRAEKKGKVIIQTHHPDHPLLQQLIKENYRDFALTLLNERQQANLPPFSYFALFRAEAHSAIRAFDFLQDIKKITLSTVKNVQLLGPIAAPMPRRAGKHRAQLLLQSDQRPLLQNFLKKIIPEIDNLPSKLRVKWSLDVDPLEMF